MKSIFLASRNCLCSLNNKMSQILLTTDETILLVDIKEEMVENNKDAADIG